MRAGVVNGEVDQLGRHDLAVYRPEIDGLRAIAIIGVLAYHAKIALISGGYAGVDVFFVISGYLITRLIMREFQEHGHFQYLRFYSRRFWRLGPALLVTLFFSFIISAFAFSPQEFESLSGSTVAALFSVSNIFFWNELGYFDIAADFKPNLHMWSLSVEEQFYFIWPALVVFLLAKVERRLICTAIVVFISVLSLLLNYLVSDHSLAFFLMPFRIFEFAIGAVLVWCVRAPASCLARSLLSIAGLAMIVASYLLYDSNTQFPYSAALLPCIGTALLIWASPNTLISRFLSAPPLVWIGVISYSLYLVHWPVVVFYSYYSGVMESFFDRFFVLASSLFLAILLHQFIEKPYRVGFQKGRVQGAWLAVGFFCFLFSVSAHAYFSNGWVWRLDERGVRNAIQVAEQENDGCIETKTFSGLFANCAFGEYKSDEKFDVVLIGDSHARTIRPGLDHLFDELGISAVWVGKGATFPALGASIVDDGRLDSRDADVYERIYEKIIEAKPAYVIFAARWDLAFNTYRHEGGRRFLVREGSQELDADSSRKVFELTVSNTVKMLKDKGISVGIFSSIPYVGPAVPNCYYRSECSVGLIPASEVLADNSEVNAFLEKLAGGENKFFNITNKLCGIGESHCIVERNGVAIFKDPHHFTPDGAKFMVAEFRSMLERFLQRN